MAAVVKAVNHGKALSVAEQISRAAMCKAKNLCYISLNEFSDGYIPSVITINGVGPVNVVSKYAVKA